MAKKARTPAREIPVGKGKAWTEALASWDARIDAASGAQAATLFHKLAEAENTPHAWAWCARAGFFLGSYATTPKESARRYEEGYELGRRGVALDAKDVSVNFWTAVCLGSWVDTMNVLRAAYHAPEIVRLLKVVADGHLEYHYGGLARFVGQALIRQPRLTEKFLGLAMPGLTPDVIIDGLRLAIESGPPFVFNIQSLGEVAYHCRNDRKTVREMLALLDMIDLDAEPSLAPDNRLDLPRARQKLTKLT